MRSGRNGADRRRLRVAGSEWHRCWADESALRRSQGPIMQQQQQPQQAAQLAVPYWLSQRVLVATRQLQHRLSASSVASPLADP